MPEPDERLAPAPPETTPPPPAEAEGLPSGWRAVMPDLRPLRRHRDYRLLTLGQSVSFLAQGRALPYTQQFQFGVQHTLPSQIRLEAAFVRQLSLKGLQASA